jgi:phosphoglycolate phosphatase
MRAKLAIFDLDGTLADTSEGIFCTARATMQALGLPSEVPMERMRKFIGPPIDECFKIVYDLPEALIPKAVDLYKKRYTEKGQFEARIYDDIPEVLDALHTHGVKLAVGTLKNESRAKSMMEHFGIAKYFDTIRGDKEEGGRSKADVLRLVVNDLSLKIDDAVLIGDTMHDKKGAMEAAMRFVAVTYGFGFVPGLKTDCGISAIVDTPKALLPLLLS